MTSSEETTRLCEEQQAINIVQRNPTLCEEPRARCWRELWNKGPMTLCEEEWQKSKEHRHCAKKERLNDIAWRATTTSEEQWHRAKEWQQAKNDDTSTDELIPSLFSSKKNSIWTFSDEVTTTWRSDKNDNKTIEEICSAMIYWSLQVFERLRDSPYELIFDLRS